MKKNKLSLFCKKYFQALGFEKLKFAATCHVQLHLVQPQGLDEIGIFGID